MKRHELIEIAGPEIAHKIMTKWGGFETWIPTLENLGPAERKKKARAMRLKGIHVRYIAERLGCSVPTVYKDLNGMPAMGDPLNKRWHGIHDMSFDAPMFWDQPGLSE